MKVYLAAPFSCQNKMRDWRADLESEGLFVTSRWLDEVSNGTIFGDDPSGNSLKDLSDIDCADLFILDGSEVSSTGGKHFETGYAIAVGKPVFVIGKRENVFHFLPQVEFHETLESAVSRIKEQ